MIRRQRNLSKYLAHCYKRGASVHQLIYYFTTDAETVWSTLEWLDVPLRTRESSRISKYHNLVAYVLREKKDYGHHLAEEAAMTPFKFSNQFMLSIPEE